ncbi:hypothetical protein IC614_00235 [Allosphingosinicella flava]|uniref:VanZ-like domain-containing protein n=1 Tax=Allosphingosinicella flava TaxID=2771430 RepID=A0A7T2GJN3_9SPHN|nr:hypothetical protein [Sphingosinicella flava]QPQ55094.1 hypothetical protein IC614_00235 [Sphingosinicella flava]
MTLGGISAAYADVKVFIEHYTGLERDALHIHLAILLYLCAMFVFRQTRRSRIPWLVVLAFEILNELFDLRWQQIQGTSLAWHESLKDLWNTMLWPTALLFIGRYTTLFGHRAGKSEGP